MSQGIYSNINALEDLNKSITRALCDIHGCYEEQENNIRQVEARIRNCFDIAVEERKLREEELQQAI